MIVQINFVILELKLYKVSAGLLLVQADHVTF